VVSQLTIPANDLSDKTTHLAEIHAAPRWLWPALVERLQQGDGLRVVRIREIVAGLKGAPEPASAFNAGDAEARLWEISENLHRADLTELERSELTSEWVRLIEGKGGQNGPPCGGIQPHDKGIGQATRILPIKGDTENAKRHNVRRAMEIDGLTPLERSEHIEEWVRLTEEKLGQNGPVSRGRGNMILPL
jgi:hypothetical protein